MTDFIRNKASISRTVLQWDSPLLEKSKQFFSEEIKQKVEKKMEHFLSYFPMTSQRYQIVLVRIFVFHKNLVNVKLNVPEPAGNIFATLFLTKKGNIMRSLILANLMENRHNIL